jgi:hypothetical protein
MTATGWKVRHTDAPFDPWVASNLDTGQTVHGATEDEAWEAAEALDAETGRTEHRPRCNRWAMGVR